MTKIICNVNLFDEKQTIHEYSFETNTITKTILLSLDDENNVIETE